MFPGLKLFQFAIFQFSFSQIKTFCEFSSTSAFFLFRSSNKSFNAVIKRTKAKGKKITGILSDILIYGIVCMIPINKKYKLAILVNCINKFLGKKLKFVYLFVWIELSGSSRSMRFETNFRSFKP